jgi:preprotein translocase subunit YajC
MKIKKVEKLKEGDRIETISGAIISVVHIIILQKDVLLLMDNYRWYNYLKGDPIEVLPPQ